MFSFPKQHILKDLNEHGIERLFSFLLIIAIKCENSKQIFEQLTTKILDCIKSITVGKLEHEKQNIIITGEVKKQCKG